MNRVWAGKEWSRGLLLFCYKPCAPTWLWKLNMYIFDKKCKGSKVKKKKEQSQEQERRLWWWGVGRVCGEHFFYNLREQGWKAKVNLQKRFSKRKEILKLPPVNWASTVAHPPQAAGTGPGGAEGVGEPLGAGRGLKTSAGWGAPLELTCRPSSPRACCS